MFLKKCIIIFFKHYNFIFNIFIDPRLDILAVTPSTSLPRPFSTRPVRKRCGNRFSIERGSEVARAAVTGVRRAAGSAVRPRGADSARRPPAAAAAGCWSRRATRSAAARTRRAAASRRRRSRGASWCAGTTAGSSVSRSCNAAAGLSVSRGHGVTALR